MKLLIVDDHPVVREGLLAVLGNMESVSGILTASDVEEALRTIRAHADLDAVLVDLSMPGVDGFFGIAAFGKLRPELPVIVISSSENPADVRRALRAGALGYIPKSTPARAMMSAVQFVLEGNVYVPPAVFVGGGGADEAPPPASPMLESPAQLTPRQLDVLRLIGEGRANKEIAAALDLSDKTVKAHVTTIFKALGVVNRTQAANSARRLGLISSADV